MSESFRSARKLKGLMISTSLERLGGAIARTLAEVHLHLPVVVVYQESRHRVWVQRLCFCVAEQVREAAAVLLVGVVLHFQPEAPEGAHLLKRSDRSAGRLPLRLKTVH